jgi:hypothetical protein
MQGGIHDASQDGSGRHQRSLIMLHRWTKAYYAYRHKNTNSRERERSLKGRIPDARRMHCIRCGVTLYESFLTAGVWKSCFEPLGGMRIDSSHKRPPCEGLPASYLDDIPYGA